MHINNVIQCSVYLKQCILKLIKNIVLTLITYRLERQNSPSRANTRQSKPNKQNESKPKKLIKTPSLKVLKSKKQTDVQTLNIPLLKVEQTRKEKQKQESKRKLLKSDTTDYENYKKMSKAFERQIELETLLADHQHLRQHRQSIAQDIFAMRHSLDDIKHRLRNSFRILDTKKTFTECKRLEKSATCEESVANGNCVFNHLLKYLFMSFFSFFFSEKQSISTV